MDDEEITGGKQMNVQSQKRKIFGHINKHRKELLERKNTKKHIQDPNTLQCNYNPNKIFKKMYRKKNKTQKQYISSTQGS